jgi:hypothetical protein
VDHQFSTLQHQAQQTATLIQTLANKLSTAAASGNPNAREWGLDLKEIAFVVRDSAIAIAFNEPFSSWTKTFTDPRLCAAIVDRLTFAGQIIETGRTSYRRAHASNARPAS